MTQMAKGWLVKSDFLTVLRSTRQSAHHDKKTKLSGTASSFQLTLAVAPFHGPRALLYPDATVRQLEPIATVSELQYARSSREPATKTCSAFCAS